MQPSRTYASIINNLTFSHPKKPVGLRVRNPVPDKHENNCLSGMKKNDKFSNSFMKCQMLFLSNWDKWISIIKSLLVFRKALIKMLFKTNGPPFSVATCEEFITSYKCYRRFPDTAGHLSCVLQKKISWLSPLEMLTYWLYDWNAEKELFKLQVSLRETTQLFTGFLCVQN